MNKTRTLTIESDLIIEIIKIAYDTGKGNNRRIFNYLICNFKASSTELNKIILIEASTI